MTDSIHLPESGLHVEDDEFIRRSNDNVMASHPLSDVLDVRLQKGLDWGAVVFTGILAVGAGGAYQLHHWGGTLGSGILGFLALCCLCAWQKRQLKLKLRQGEVSYDLKESEGDCQGFLLSLKSHLEHRRRN